MTDPLGASQVMPYLCGLSALGHEIFLMSFEKEGRMERGRDAVKKTLDGAGIQWFPQAYTAKPPVISTLRDVRTAKREAQAIIEAHNIQCLHCRSYIAALVGLHFQKKKNIPFLFDMRGFWADERVDGKLWNLRNPLYRAVYNYFKKKEKAFLAQSAHIVSLTDAGKEEMLTWHIADVSAAKITVIPCCTDTELFKPITDQPLLSDYRKSLNLLPDQPVISYLGSMGTWYLSGAMFDFFRVFLNTYSNAVFLLITQDDPAGVIKLAGVHGVPETALRIRPATRNEVPALLSLSHANLFFIQPVFSKKASSPTKMGESLSVGVPVICNDGVGDCSRILNAGKAGLVVKELNTAAYEATVQQFENIRALSADGVRNLALQQLSLTEGIRRYQQIYTLIQSQRS